MGNLHFISAGSKLTAIPEAAGGLHCQEVNNAGKNNYNPSGYVIDTFVIHIGLL